MTILQGWSTTFPGGLKDGRKPPSGCQGWSTTSIGAPKMVKHLPSVAMLAQYILVQTFMHLCESLTVTGLALSAYLSYHGKYNPLEEIVCHCEDLRCPEPEPLNTSVLLLCILVGAVLLSTIWRSRGWLTSQDWLWNWVYISTHCGRRRR